MFRGKKYLTRGVDGEIPLELQLLMWEYIRRMPVDRDYLQVFILSQKGNSQEIIHKQAEPEYGRKYTIKSISPLNEKIYVIDDGEYATMLLASEY